jgi:predicted metal-dependent peptidase
MKPDSITEKYISALLMDIAKRNAFFASLTLQARIEVSKDIPTAATDGNNIYVNPQFFAKMTLPEQTGVLLHEVLHAALLHVPRRGSRDPKIWNIAADIVVNGIITDEGYALPEGGIHDARLKHFGVEEVYEKLIEEAPTVNVTLFSDDLLDGPPDDAESNSGQGDMQHGQAAKKKLSAAAESKWRHAMEQARMLAQTAGQGKLPLGVARELENMHTSQIDWRSYLWRYMVQSPSDFGGFDRRFISDGVYLEVLEALKVNVIVAVDSSGSINQRDLTALASEVRAINESYPDIGVTMYYADSELYGPYELTASAPLPAPKGGGGTDFRPFFEEAQRNMRPREFNLGIYLTDGYGDFPEQTPSLPTLWVVTPGGRKLEDFPFGEAVRLLQSG